MITREQFNNLKVGDKIVCYRRRMTVTRAPYKEGELTKIVAKHVTKMCTSIMAICYELSGEKINMAK